MEKNRIDRTEWNGIVFTMECGCGKCHKYRTEKNRMGKNRIGQNRTEWNKIVFTIYRSYMIQQSRTRNMSYSKYKAT